MCDSIDNIVSNPVETDAKAKEGNFYFNDFNLTRWMNDFFI